MEWPMRYHSWSTEWGPLGWQATSARMGPCDGWSGTLKPHFSVGMFSERTELCNVTDGQDKPWMCVSSPNGLTARQTACHVCKPLSECVHGCCHCALPLDSSLFNICFFFYCRLNVGLQLCTTRLSPLNVSTTPVILQGACRPLVLNQDCRSLQFCELSSYCALGLPSMQTAIAVLLCPCHMSRPSKPPFIIYAQILLVLCL